ncbi:pyridoxal-phosphate dependent enzyme [Salsipaludibacter albus]|uniref:pyridoxal-phosphate dependent enzyme n=1 Tax=Salsipaludibacter albus TaxID=2849650 RepID=UPI001EE4C7FD|nr:pyridoxal-phosphate dependent enzyme [Salsipaludibacter albus]MBY5164229.1 pyridoxal-phosphate dependent enzyme [Salsipaludibacter albus]
MQPTSEDHGSAVVTVAVGDVEAAAERIRGLVVHTPAITSAPLGERVGHPVRLKLEGLQPTGSFKVRGAASRILAEPGRPTDLAGVVTASTGNHGRAMAHVARELGVHAVVCVSDNVPAGKVAALRALGCELVVGGESQTAALVTAAGLVEERGLTLVHPFDDPLVVAGQGTIGLEVVAQAPETATLLVPLSGGGLLAGIAVAVTARRPDVRVVGLSMPEGAVMAASLAAGRPVDLPESPTLADSLQGGIGLDNRHTFPAVRDLVDDVVLVDEDAIWEGMRFALAEHRLVLEGAGAIGIGALLAGAVEVDGPVTVVCSGANAELDHVAALATDAPRPT